MDITKIKTLEKYLSTSSKSLHKEFYAKKNKDWIKEGEKQALGIFHSASERVPAYKDFLKKHNVNPRAIKTLEDFRQVPPTTKENYIEKYDIEKRCWNGNFSDIHVISTSSGTSGEPHFWPRNLSSEVEGAYMHELLLSSVYDMKKKKTLFLNGFPMGSWIAGTFTLACTHLMSWKGYPLVSINPGYSDDPIILLLEKMASKFEQTIISGHTPFLKEVVEMAVKKGINFRKTKVILLGTGQGITENWRAYILKLLASNDYYHTMLNLYGSADANLMGFETPFSIFLRKILSNNQKLKKKVFNDERLPSLYNFDPRITYIEEKEGQLHITKDTGSPLIRYNIQDEGSVLSFQNLMDFFPHIDQKLKREEQQILTMRLPFVYLFGREKFMVKIYGANVYSEHVQHALNHKKLQPILTGRYILEMGYDANQNPQMICRVELIEGVNRENNHRTMIEEIFVEQVRKINSEYNYVLNEMGMKARPVIMIHLHGDSKYFPKGVLKKTA